MQPNTTSNGDSRPPSTAKSPASPDIRARSLRIAIPLIAILMVIYAGVMATFYFRQESIIFLPTKLPASHTFSIPDVQEVSVQVDGATLSALHFRLPNPKGVVFFLHGNAGSLASWVRNVEFYRRANFDLFMIDYRGYGKSTGEITSEAQLHRDVRAAWEQIVPEYAGKQNVILGRSLGTALAARLAANVKPAMTVLVSPYASLEALGREVYPFLPSALLRYPLRTIDWLPSVKGRVLLVHGDQDTLIPHAHSVRLKQSTPEAELLTIHGGGHNDLQDRAEYVEGLQAALAAL